jgi:hypothetical protein
MQRQWRRKSAQNESKLIEYAKESEAKCETKEKALKR